MRTGKSLWVAGALGFAGTLAATVNPPAGAEVVNCAECEMLRVNGLGNQTLQDFLGTPGSGAAGALGSADQAAARYLVRPRSALVIPSLAPYFATLPAVNWDYGQELPGASLIPTLPWRHTDFNPGMIAPFYNERDGALFDHPAAPWNRFRLYPVGQVLL